ncbi:MarR family winged helix-turn-helix transcriptional regulator [Hoeflea poritis]|uniref:MarR family transcriptional regulator n=1 Tax=Hoeflea poritis TaxID=2993659 RepID=A0ABT4VP11_9HYPH|nr:MarR family transcriptional regulator [Hoeflea poritis]MDA4846456.1 MarR family transcriptional regulator [Hoeflea poritis]
MERSTDPSGFDNAIFRFFRELAAVSQSADRLVERALPDELKQPHFNVLDFLARNDGRPTMGELALAMNVTRGAISNTVRRLEERGYVTVSADRRSKRVGLTASGRAAHRDGIEALVPPLLELARTISAPDMIEILPLLERIRGYLDAEAGRPG